MPFLIRYIVVLSFVLASCDVIDKDKLNSITGPRVTCNSPVKVLLVGETATFSYGFANMGSSPLSFGVDLDEDPTLFFKDWGSVAAGATATSVTYTAPGVIPPIAGNNNPFLRVPVQATAEARSIPGACNALLVNNPGYSILLDPDPTLLWENPVATVYKIGPFATNIPANMTAMTPYKQFPLRTINAQGNFAMPDLGMDYGLRVVGKLVVSTPGSYTITLVVSRGGNFYLDGVKQIDNSGNHASVGANKTLTLTAGDHPFVVEAYQDATAGGMSLGLQWSGPSTGGNVVVPATALKY